MYKINTDIFHSLWSKAVGTPNYNKDQWMQLDGQINSINKILEKTYDLRLKIEELATTCTKLATKLQ